MLIPIILRIGLGIEFDQFSIILFLEMDIGSDTMVPTAYTQVATPTVTQAPVMPTTVPISVSPGEKPEKFSGLNFKR